MLIWRSGSKRSPANSYEIRRVGNRRPLWLMAARQRRSRLCGSEMRKLPTKSAHGRSGTRRTTILTIGHSTRSVGTFIQMLEAYGVKRLVDVRTIPRSRHNPQFNRDELPGTLLQAGIGYTHMEELGGLRHARRDSPNTGWHNTSFRGFADYMQTPEFQTGIKTLIQAAKREQVAIMCAEAVPWRCHRSLIGDALGARGIAVEDIMSESRVQAHELTSFARVKGEHVTYPAPD